MRGADLLSPFQPFNVPLRIPLPSYDDHSADRRAYDRRYCDSYRRNDYSRERGDAYYEPEYRHSYEYRRSRDREGSYRSCKSSRRKHRRRRRRSRSFSRSSSVSILLCCACPVTFLSQVPSWVSRKLTF